jgi:hypothetical protein
MEGKWMCVNTFLVTDTNVIVFTTVCLPRSGWNWENGVCQSPWTSVGALCACLQL